jgi:hypothetical protein
LALRICACLALAFCVWTVAFSDLKLLLVGLGFLALTLPLWLAAQRLGRARGAAAAQLPS